MPEIEKILRNNKKKKKIKENKLARDHIGAVVLNVK
jgi:hypothetical protein